MGSEQQPATSPASVTSNVGVSRANASDISSLASSFIKASLKRLAALSWTFGTAKVSDRHQIRQETGHMLTLVFIRDKDAFLESALVKRSFLLLLFLSLLPMTASLHGMERCMHGIQCCGKEATVLKEC
jgi:hypothetical protein